ncbi:MAG: hypothetical protein M1833_000325 [Piccolia ochrophora]|nr:MAG: hypothetical protein M1833_000325 [Piccolia ochrophora]
MSTISRLSNAVVSAKNENTLALANFNVDFSIVKIEAPKEFLGLASALTPQRRETAEHGPLHRTARRLGALFEQILPSTPKLFKAYGQRASEISQSPSVNPKGSAKDGVFANFVGADGTSIWSAATSGEGAIAAHLLACLLARTFSSLIATSILVELVAERRKELEIKRERGHFDGLIALLAAQDITRPDLAKWDASARAWLQCADEAKKLEQTQLRLIVKNAGLQVNSSSSTYSNVVGAWTTAMTTMEALISGMPQRISKGAVI